MSLISEIKKAEEIRDKEKNAFILCQNKADLSIVSEIFKIEFSETMAFPFIIRIGRGKFKDLIPKSELKGLKEFLDCTLTFSTPCNGESWRYAGMFTKHYNWKAKDWQEHWKGVSEGFLQAHLEAQPSPYDKCYMCNRPFEPNENLYQSFIGKGDSCRLRCSCKECAYKYSEKVTDYDFKDGEVSIKKMQYKKGEWQESEE